MYTKQMQFIISSFVLYLTSIQYLVTAYATHTLNALIVKFTSYLYTSNSIFISNVNKTNITILPNYYKFKFNCK